MLNVEGAGAPVECGSIGSQALGVGWEREVKEDGEGSMLFEGRFNENTVKTPFDTILLRPRLVTKTI